MDSRKEIAPGTEMTFKYEVNPKTLKLLIITDVQTTSLIWTAIYRKNGVVYLKKPHIQWRGEATPERMELFAEHLEIGTQDKMFTSAPTLSITLGELDNVPIIIIRSGLTTITIVATEAARYSLARVVRWYAQFCRETPVWTQATRYEHAISELGNYERYGEENIVNATGYDSDRD